ncbi:MAG: hypothetical protein JWM44_3365 [Bacilli bacterium]|nr:hypothetical protein [Bacilli bacterium]
MRNSLRFKFVVGFLMIIIPLVLFLLFNNIYASNVVREQVSKTNTNLLAQHVNQIDTMLFSTNNYLKLVNENEADINSLNFLDFNSDDYTIAKQRVVNRFRTNLNYYQYVDSFFLYNIKGKDLAFASTMDYYSEEETILSQIPAELTGKDDSDTPKWKLINSGNRYSLIKFFRINDNFFAGAVVKTDSLVKSLLFLDMGESGGAIIVSNDGVAVSGTTKSGGSLSNSKLKVANSAPKMSGKLYQIVSDQADGKKYLLIGVPSSAANITYSALIPEANILQNLPFFRLAVYIIPLGGVLLLLFYLILLRNILLKPMKTLMHGMNQLIRGDLNVQLNENHSSEFAFLIGTFNTMVLEISRLKIDVYEEKLHTQQAGFRLLQVQIRPHFYLNSLNIIYSLASIKEYALIQKMTQHLAEYFRFIIHTNRGTVTLEEETRHVGNYLEIQKLRFPNQLAYEIELADQYRECIILPLTIQTFVENAIIHGFADRKELFNIHIRIVADEQAPDYFLWIIVSDSGKGFSESILQSLQDGSYQHEIFEEGHLGIQNVLQRQQIHYGGKAKLLFRNGEDKGAEISIGIPMDFDETEEEDDV